MYVWTSTSNTGSNISATAPFVAFGTSTTIAARLGSSGNPQARVATGGTTTLVAAPTIYRVTGINIGTNTLASVLPLSMVRDDFDGTSVLGQGTAIHLMGSTAIATTATLTFIWEEVPV